MKEIFLAISDFGACMFCPKNNFNGEFVRFCASEDAKTVAAEIKKCFDFNKKKLVIAANTKKTLIRIKDRDVNHKFRKKISNSDAWDVINAAFPIGPSINADSYLFDISVFGNKKYACFGLPIEKSEFLAEIGAELTGSLHKVIRIETIENLIFNKFCCENAGSLIVVFPQDAGYRVLVMQDGLPENAFYISDHPIRREDEFLYILEKSKDRKICELNFMPAKDNTCLEWVTKYK